MGFHSRGRKMSIVRIGLAILLLFVNLNCSVNVLETFGDKNTNEALYIDALKAITDGDYAGGLAKIALMTGAYPAMEKVVTLKASAYGGICGINFLTFAQDLGAMTTNLFPFLVSEFKGATSTKIDACLTGQDLITGIGAVGVRNNDENMLLLLLAFAKIGNILSFYADTAPADGSADAAYNVCTVGGSRTAGGAISDSDARELGTGITLALEALTAVGSSVNLGSGSLTTLNSVCASLGPANFCAITVPSAFSVAQVKGVRTMFKESTVIGLGTNCTGDVSVCNCP
jgi:hypothetical protein